MPVVSIFSAARCHGDEVAKQVAEGLGYEILSNEKLLTEAARRFKTSGEKLNRAMTGPRSVFNRLTHEKERSVAYLRAALAELIKDDNVVYHGFAGHLLPKSLNNVLRVCLVAKQDYRVQVAMKEGGHSEKEARKQISKEDEVRQQWTLYLFGLSPWEKSLYDILLPMDDTEVATAAENIIKNAKKPPLRTTPASRNAIDDFLLDCKVYVALAEEGHDVGVESKSGVVTVTINRYVMRLESYEEELTEIASAVPGVKNVKTKVGPHFNQPNIYPKLDLPKKILLVDDEKEFVTTLSERLQTRNLEAAIAYDGEEALSIMENDVPEVMVLDLKMPGIDGLEVLRRVKREHPETEVIILTGHGSEAEKQLAGELGAFAYLQKPVDIDVLSQTMKDAYQAIAREKTDQKESDEG